MELNPTLLFNRITWVLNNSSEMGSFFAYEFAPQPPSLFYGGAMRKPTKSYLSLLLKSFTKQTKLQSTVGFDGYGSTTSTKVAEQRRRAQKCTSVDIIFHDDMPTTTTQAAFLTNGNNKKRLIESL